MKTTLSCFPLLLVCVVFATVIWWKSTTLVEIGTSHGSFLTVLISIPARPQGILTDATTLLIRVVSQNFKMSRENLDVESLPIESIFRVERNLTHIRAPDVAFGSVFKLRFNIGSAEAAILTVNAVLDQGATCFSQQGKFRGTSQHILEFDEPKSSCTLEERG